MEPTTAGEQGRIDVPADPRDLPGTFPHRLALDVRFGDTDAMGHMNNARYLTFCESARVDYWEQVDGPAIRDRHPRRDGEHDPRRHPGDVPVAGLRG